MVLSGQASPGEFSSGHHTEATVVRQGYGDIEAAFRAAPVSSNSSSPAAGTRACRSRPAARIGRLRRRRATCWSCTAPPGCRTATGTDRTDAQPHPSSVNCSELPRRRRVSAFAASFTRGRARAAWPPCGSSRPVKWIEDRREHLIAANHSRKQLHNVRARGDGDGEILAIDDEIFHDHGAYVRTHATARRRYDGGVSARTLSRAGLSRDRSFSPDQQDAGRDLPRARPLRDNLRARAAGRCDRAPGSASIRIDVRRRMRSLSRKCRIKRPLEALGRGNRLRFRRLSRACSTSCSPMSNGTSSTPI